MLTWTLGFPPHLLAQAMAAVFLHSHCCELDANHIEGAFKSNAKRRLCLRLILC